MHIYVCLSRYRIRQSYHADLVTETLLSVYSGQCKIFKF